jgi:hypothetical protein
MARSGAIRLGLGSGIGLLPNRSTVANCLDEHGAVGIALVALQAADTTMAIAIGGAS